MNRKHMKQIGALLITISLMGGCAQKETVEETGAESTLSVVENTETQNTQVEAVFSLETETLISETDKLYIEVDLPVAKFGEELALDATRVLQKPIRDAMNYALTNADFWAVKDEAFEQKRFTGGFEVVYEDAEVITIKPIVEEQDYLMPVTLVKASGEQLDFSDLPNSESFWIAVNEAALTSLSEEVSKETRRQVFSNYYISDTELVFFVPEWLRLDESMERLEISLDTLDMKRVDFLAYDPAGLEVGAKQHVVSTSYYTFAGEIPVFNSDSNPEMASQLTALMDKQIVMNEKLVEDDAKALYESNKADGFIYPPEIHNVEFDVMRKDSEFLSLYLMYYSYTGGAHGMHYDLAYNFDMATGNRIELKDLFKEDADYVAVLNREVQTQIDLIQKEFIEKNGGEWAPYMGFETIAEDQHFYLTNDALVVFFDLYEIAPYASGIPTFEIPFTNIEDSLK